MSMKEILGVTFIIIPVIVLFNGIIAGVVGMFRLDGFNFLDPLALVITGLLAMAIIGCVLTGMFD